MRKIAILLLLLSSILKAQNESTFVDNKYLEDQLYFNLTYIKLLELPDQISQSGFSFGLGFGFIKDIPINARRNFGLGIGLGYGLNNYYFNVKENIEIPSERNTALKSNKIVMHTIEMPLEIRFRTSTPEKYKFWRFYPGLKMAYVFAKNTNLRQREDFDVEDIVKINRFLYGITFSSGFNKWNFHVYYGLNEIFSNTKNNEYKFNVQDIRLGLIFYML
jgi:hypothetical protein